jgi:hypothetical protein
MLYLLYALQELRYFYLFMKSLSTLLHFLHHCQNLIYSAIGLSKCLQETAYVCIRPSTSFNGPEKLVSLVAKCGLRHVLNNCWSISSRALIILGCYMVGYFLGGIV